VQHNVIFKINDFNKSNVFGGYIFTQINNKSKITLAFFTIDTKTIFKKRHKKNNIFHYFNFSPHSSQTKPQKSTSNQQTKFIKLMSK
jgi:hypothetical protein